MNAIIGKRQIILAALVLGLGVAVWANWQYSNSSIDFPVTKALDSETDTHGDTYGEAQYVDAPTIVTPEIEDGEAYFVEAKMSRQKARDEAVETLATMLKDTELEADQKTQLAMKATELAQSIEAEGKMENMIRAKGFEDVMVYYDTLRADVIVKTKGLLPNEATQIKDIVLKETSITPENISIIEIN